MPSDFYEYLEVAADEDGAYAIPVTFKDEYDEEIIPEAVYFTVLDIDKSILNNSGNGNEEVTDTLSSSMNIKIPEASLAIQTAEENKKRVLRFVEIQAEYSSSVYDTNKRMVSACYFDLHNRKSTAITIS